MCNVASCLLVFVKTPINPAFNLSVRHPPRLCFGLPGLKFFAKACVEIYNVNLQSHSMCVRLAGEVNIIVSLFVLRLLKLLEII